MSAVMANITTLWSKEKLLERVMQNEEIYFTLLMVFIEDVPKLIQKLEASIAERDFVQIKALAHNLKGSFYNLTADHFGDLCKSIEEASKQQNIENAQELFDELNTHVPLLTDSFQRELETK